MSDLSVSLRRELVGFFCQASASADAALAQRVFNAMLTAVDMRPVAPREIRLSLEAVHQSGVCRDGQAAGQLLSDYTDGHPFPLLSQLTPGRERERLVVVPNVRYGGWRINLRGERGHGACWWDPSELAARLDLAVTHIEGWRDRGWLQSNAGGQIRGDGLRTFPEEDARGRRLHASLLEAANPALGFGAHELKGPPDKTPPAFSEPPGFLLDHTVLWDALVRPDGSSHELLSMARLPVYRPRVAAPLILQVVQAARSWEEMDPGAATALLEQFFALHSHLYDPGHFAPAPSHLPPSEPGLPAGSGAVDLLRRSQPVRQALSAALRLEARPAVITWIPLTYKAVGGPDDEVKLLTPPQAAAALLAG